MLYDDVMTLYDDMMILYDDVMILYDDVMTLDDDLMMYMMLTWWRCMITRWCETYYDEMT